MQQTQHNSPSQNAMFHVYNLYLVNFETDTEVSLMCEKLCISVYVVGYRNKHWKREWKQKYKHISIADSLFYDFVLFECTVVIAFFSLPSPYIVGTSACIMLFWRHSHRIQFSVDSCVYKAAITSGYCRQNRRHRINRTTYFSPHSSWAQMV